ncbi:DUF4214 domain-containing protein [Polynucleobacter sp. 31A-FELB]|uniref:DUF4214 domain-containing protein n=1 Tax=Polynucleobacter sp. 31A-FELB TaxID=2689096 RepID=UPI001C0BA0D3|nr:DUF4214 domain-containing protein [Polynucleobacter sp. 31A-FELB]MBU3587836.1 DUF4214 domain-containing protein [Polynucleobacter sp. 31A-FELB]
MTSIVSGPLNYSGTFTYAAGNDFSYAVRYLYSEDLNSDGLDELIFAGFETQPNTPSSYTNTQVSIFGWSNGNFVNLTSQWLPNGANLVEGVGDIVFGDFNGDGRVDAYLSGNADMEYEVHSYALLNQGNYFIRQDLGITKWEHGVASGDINRDGFVDVVPAGYIHPSAFYLGGNSGLTKQLVGDGNNFNSYETFASGITFADFLGNGSQRAIVVDSATAVNSSDTSLVSVVLDPTGNVQGFKYISTLPIPRLELPQYGVINPNYDNSHDVRVRAIDFSNDGLMDAIVFSRAGWDGSQWPTKSQVQFLQNIGNGQFDDVTTSRLIGYELNSNVAYTPIIEDINFDGLPDIFLSEASWSNVYRSTSILIAQQDGSYVDTARQQLSSYITNQEGIASLVKGPNNQFYMVVERQVRGGDASVSTVALSFPERENSESLAGTIYSDVIFGLGGNDSISGEEGDDVIDGGSGIDLAVYLGLATEYIFRINVSNTEVSDVMPNRDGTDTLTNIERLAFSDINVALDIGPSQNAGSVYMLYKAAFNRAPDEGGMGYWLAQKDGGANIVTNIAQGFVNSGEFTAKYGANPTNASYVDKLYLNVLGRAGEAEGVAYWNQQLDAGNISKAAVLVQFATLAEGASLVADLIANGIPYTEWVG